MRLEFETKHRNKGWSHVRTILVFICICHLCIARLQPQSPTHSLGSPCFRSAVFAPQTHSTTQFPAPPKPVDAIVLSIGTYSYPFGQTFWAFVAMLSLSLSQFSFIAALTLFFAGTRLDAKSVIVDDADTTNITYSSGWNIGNDCPSCFAQPSTLRAFDRTWHE
jgi:hypothetical protein